MSEIGAKRLLMRLGDILKIKDVRQAPSELDTSSVKVVAPLDMGWADYTPWTRFTTGLAISGAGNGTFAWPVVGDQAQGFSLVIPSAARKLNTAGEENVVLGVSIQFGFDAAGALAENGTEVEIYARQRETFAGDPRATSPNAVPAFTIITNRLRYVWAYPDWFAKVPGGDPAQQFALHAGRPIWVPAGAGLDIVVDHMGITGTPGGRDFPANTVVDLYSWGVSCPKGFRPPGL